MPLDYSPKDAENCWPEGEYEAELVQVLDKTSKMKPDGTGGNAMQEWKVKVHHDDGRTQLLSDYFVPPAGTFKLKQLSAALGRKEEFKASTFQADDHEGATFKVKLMIEAGSGGFDDKNKIGKYLPAAQADTPAPKPAPAARQAPPMKPIPRQVANPIPAGGGIPAEDIPF